MGNCLQSEQNLDVDDGGGWKVDTPKASAVAPASPEKEAPSPYSPFKIHRNHQVKSLRLYGDPMCPITMQILLALRHKGLQYDCSWLETGVKDAKLDWSARSGSATAVTPVLQHGIQNVSGPPDAIIKYLDSSFPERPLVPKGEVGKRVREWALFLRDTLSPLALQLLYDGDPSIQHELAPELDIAFSKVNSALGKFTHNGPYFFGGVFTLADVSLIPVLALMDPLKHFRDLEIGSMYLSLLTYKKDMDSFPVYTAAKVTPEALRLYVANKLEQRTPPPLIILMLMQHRSILWHFERLVILSDDLVGSLENTKTLTPSRRGAAGRTIDSNLKKLWKGYGRLVELMQEHAQMEERVIFPELEHCHEGVTEVANADHGKDLPVMNGIKEDLKCLLALDQGSSDYGEAIRALAIRLRKFQLHTQEHFQDEEKEFLPVLDSPAFGEGKADVESFVTHCLGVMEASHAQLFPFLLAGLNPKEVYQYMMVLHKNLWDTKPTHFTRMLHVIQNSDEEYRSVKKLVREKFSEYPPFKLAAAAAAGA